VAFDPDNLDQSKFNFIVTVNSVDTNNSKRDNHLRSKDFFDSDTFPVMAFNSSKITRITDNRYVLQGQLTIEDVTKTMDLEFSYFPSKPHPIMENNLVSGFYTQFDIFRLDFHVGNGKFLKMGVVGETANVEISMEATRKQ